MFFIIALVITGQLDEAAYGVNRPRPKRKLRKDSEHSSNRTTGQTRLIFRFTDTPLLQPISSLADAHTKNSATTPVESEKPDFGEEIVTGRKLPGSSTRVFEGSLKDVLTPTA